MKCTFNKMLSFFLVLCLLATFMPSVFAENNLYVKITENNANSLRLYKSSEAPGFSAYIQNRSTAGTATVNAVLKNLTLNSNVWTSSQSVSIGGKKQIKVDFAPVYSAQNGFGKLEFSVSVTLNGETYTVVTDPFTRVNGSETTISDIGYNTYMYLSTNWRNATVLDHINALGAGGFGMIRESLEWEAIEVGNSGTYRISESYLDYLRSIKQNGGRILWVLGYNNRNYGVSTNTIIPTAENGTLEPFKNYCEWVVQELDGIVDDFEVWNEPDIEFFNQTQSAQQYYDLLKAVYPLIKNARANRSANVVGMATSSGIGANILSKDGPGSPNNAGGKPFMYYVVQLGGLNYMDKVSIHDYPQGAFDIAENRNFTYFFSRVFSELGTYSKPIIISEIGYSTGIYSVTQKARFMARILPLIKSLKTRSGYSNVNIDGICFYQLFDKKARTQENKSDPEFCFGSLYDDTSAKPDFISTAFSNKMLGNVSSVSVITENGSGLNKYSFTTENGENAYVMWYNDDNSPSSQTVTFSNRSGYRTKVYDMYGNLESISNSNSVAFNLSTNAKYVVYSNIIDASVTASIPQKPVSYIYPTPVTETCSMTVNNGNVAISGTANSEYVSIIARPIDKGINDSKVVEVVPVTSNAFSKTISLPQGKVYLISVSTGVTKENMFTTNEADGRVQLTSDENGTVSAEVTFDRCNMTNPILMAAVYDGDLLKTFDIDDNDLSVSVSSSQGEITNIMLWEKDSISPIFEKINMSQ